MGLYTWIQAVNSYIIFKKDWIARLLREHWNGTVYRILDPDDHPTGLMSTVMHVIREQRGSQIPYAFFLGPCATPIAGSPRNSHVWQLFSSYAPAIASKLTLIFHTLPYVNIYTAYTL